MLKHPSPYSNASLIISEPIPHSHAVSVASPAASVVAILALTAGRPLLGSVDSPAASLVARAMPPKKFREDSIFQDDGRSKAGWLVQKVPCPSL